MKLTHVQTREGRGAHIEIMVTFDSVHYDMVVVPLGASPQEVAQLLHVLVQRVAARGQKRPADMAYACPECNRREGLMHKSRCTSIGVFVRRPA